MSKSSATIPLRYLRALLDLLREKGFATEPVLAAVWDARQGSISARSDIGVSDVDLLINAVVSACQQPDLALDLGRSIRLTSHSFAGLAALVSADYGSAVRIFESYFPLVMPAFSLSSRLTRETLDVAVRPLAGMSDVATLFCLEAMVFSGYFNSVELLKQALPALDIFVSWERPGYAARYHEATRVRWHFGALRSPGFLFRLPRSVAGARLELADASALDTLKAACPLTGAARTADARLADLVYLQLQKNLAVQSVEDIASHFHLSSRTLTRKLKDEGANFRELLVLARMRAAKTLLATTTHSIARIAGEVGYHDASNFTRAFRRVTGLPPAEFRAASQSDPGLS